MSFQEDVKFLDVLVEQLPNVDRDELIKFVPKIKKYTEKIAKHALALCNRIVSEEEQESIYTQAIDPAVKLCAKLGVEFNYTLDPRGRTCIKFPSGYSNDFAQQGYVIPINPRYM